MTEERARWTTKRRRVQRVQTGVRMEKRVLQLLKALASTLDITLGDLLEGIVLHAIEGKSPFGPDTLAKIDALRGVLHLDLTAADSHLLVERKRR
ncbi:MAG TPA: hypothetical protein VMJ10_25190 [Kofleriaceae bacterium]|nr:hypothetical protein [Kofleriaceae bacterium]